MKPPEQTGIRITIPEIIQFRAMLGSAPVQSEKLQTTLELLDDIIITFVKDLNFPTPNKDN